MLVEATANLPGFQMMTGDQRDVNEKDPEVRRALELGTLRPAGGGVWETTTRTETPARRSGCRGCGGR